MNLRDQYRRAKMRQECGKVGENSHLAATACDGDCWQTATKTKQRNGAKKYAGV